MAGAICKNSLFWGMVMPHARYAATPHGVKVFSLEIWQIHIHLNFLSLRRRAKRSASFLAGVQNASWQINGQRYGQPALFILTILRNQKDGNSMLNKRHYHLM